MKTYTQTEELTVAALHVKDFPSGVKDAFNSLSKIFGNNRGYYGISWMDDNNNIVYYAAAQESFPGEAAQHGYALLRIEKGDYKTETIHNWMSKTDCIKNVFHDLMGDQKTGKDNPCIEWYQSDDEMLCMIKAK